MVEPILNVTKRVSQGSAEAGRMRRAGRVPGVVYGPGKDNLVVEVDGRDLERLMQSGHATGLVALAVDGGKKGEQRKVLIKEMQRDFLKGRISHVDFLEVAMDHPVTTMVPVVVHGEDQRRGLLGVVQHVLHSLEISCLPADIPEHVVVDVAQLEVGHSIHAADLKVPRGVKVLTSPEDVVVTIVAPTRERVEEQPAEEGAAQPEVVGKGKAEE